MPEQELYRALLDSALDWEYLLDAQGNFIYVSPSCKETTGFSPEDYYSDPGLLERIIHPEDLPLFKEHLHQEFNSELQGSLFLEFRLLRRGMQECWISHFCRPFYGNDGQFIGRRASNRDITRQKELETSLRLITDNMLDLISQTDHDGVFQFVSPSVQHVLGYTQEELLGKSAFDLVHPDDQQKVRDMFQKGMKQGITQQKAEYRYLHAQGHYVWLETLGKLLKDERGDISGAVLSSRDISKRKKIDNELEGIFNLSVDILGIANQEGYFQKLSPACETILGRSAEELKSRPFLEFVHPEDREATEVIFQELLEKYSVQNFQNRYQHKDGSYRWLAWDSFFSPGDGLIYFVARDVTEIKDAQQKLQEREEKITALFNAAENVSLIMTDADPDSPRVLEFSSGAENIFGYSRDEMLGQKVEVLHNKEDVAQFPKMTEKMRRQKKGFSGETIMRRKSGEVFPAHFSTYPLVDAQGNMYGTLGVSIDITDQKNAELELQKAKDDLESRVQERTAQLTLALDSLKNNMRGIIQAMGRILEKRDQYTSGHQQRVASLAEAIAREMGLEDERIQGLRLAAEIHDIGKIAIPAEILAKPGRLEDVEFEIIKSHPQSGYDILKDIEFSWPVADMVLQHHEKINGSGYPEGLSGDKICLESRIMCVADVVEAMASHRPYRPGLGIAAALEEIQDKAGELFDPEVVKACVRLFQDKGFDLEA